jgi:cell wall-associated NlpC family hydrolase
MDSWLGVPYKYGGNSKSGTDCSGMIQQIYKNVYGIQLHRSAFDMQKDVDLISLEKAKLGDIVFFKIDQNKVSHVGLYIGDKKFIHASTSKGVIISSLDEDYYKTRFYAMGRVKGKK